MEAEADLEPLAVRPFVVEESDQAAGLVLDRDVIVASRRRVEQLGEIIRVGRPVVERERVGAVRTRDRLRVRLADQPETERHHWLFAIPFSGRRHALGIITPRCFWREESTSAPSSRAQASDVTPNAKPQRGRLPEQALRTWRPAGSSTSGSRTRLPARRPAGLIVHAAGPTDEGFGIPGLPERPGASCRHTRPAANACDGPVRQAERPFGTIPPRF